MPPQSPHIKIYPLGLFGLIFLLTSCTFWLGNNERDPKSRTKDDNGLLLTLWIDHYCYEVGESVHVRFTLENTSEKTVVLGGGDGPAVDAVIYEENGDNTISWAEAMTMTETLTSLELEAGETYEIDWSIIPPDYHAYGVRGIEVRGGEPFHISLPMSSPPYCQPRIIP